MTERVKRMLNFLKSKEYVKMRCNDDSIKILDEKSSLKRQNTAFNIAVDNEQPLFFTDDDIFGFNRYMTNLPTLIYGEDSMRGSNNMCVDYVGFLKSGFNGIINKINEMIGNANFTQKEFYLEALKSIDIAMKIVKKYREKALEDNKMHLYNALNNVPFNGATNYYEALLSVKFLQYALRLNLCNHVTLGRFDLYMKDYYDISIKNGKTKDELEELTQLFFISLNFDTDLYDGIQLGDNGQSLMLGGVDRDGNDVYSELTELCLDVSRELSLIDPKINLRVNKNTPLSIYQKGTALTKKGLGFPQYSNDDIIIDGLRGIGYDIRDARDYTVAACWEYIIPAYSYEVCNIIAINLPLIVEKTVKNHLLNSQTFNDFKKAFELELEKESEQILSIINKKHIEPDAFTSLFFPTCIASGKDISSGGAKYNNYGIHGVGISTATDSLYGVYKSIYLDKTVTKSQLLLALEKDFNGYEDLQKTLLSYAKMGDNDDVVDQIACYIMEQYSLNIQNKKNNRGGIVRAGTGSSLEYIRMAKVVGATADGRKAGVPFSSNFAPSITARVKGPISVISSFSKFDMKKLINGGPLTIEIHDSVFRNVDGERKTAMLVKSYIDKGGHQIQINAINRDKLLDAQKHPELYPNLIVRVWGWSGYFNELDIEYQNHVIKRAEFTFN